MLLRLKRKRVTRLITLLLCFSVFLSTCPIKALAFTSSDAPGGSNLLYDFTTQVQIYEIAQSLTVTVNITSQPGAENGVLIISLYNKYDTANKEIHVFTQDTTPDTAEASTTLSYSGLPSAWLIVKVAVWDSLDKIRPLSVCKTYERNDFVIPEATMSTLDPTDTALDGATVWGQAGGDIGAANAYGFIVADANPAPNSDSILDLIGKVQNGSLPLTMIQAADSITADGRFSLKLSGLEQGKTYSYAAISADGTVLGSVNSFTTLDNFPRLSIGYIMPELNQGYIGIENCYITDNRGLPVTECGFVYGSAPNALINKAVLHVSPMMDPYLTKFSGAAGVSPSGYGYFKPGNTYFVRAYASNAEGTGYSGIKSFTMPLITPIMGPASADFDPLSWSLSLTGSIRAAGGSASSYGFRYRRSGDTDWKYLQTDAGVFEGTYTMQLVGLSQFPPGDYTFQAFAVNDTGMSTIYADRVIAPYPPSVTLKIDQAAVKSDSVVLSGNITDTFRSDITARGFDFRLAADSVWHQAEAETGTFGAGGFTYTLTGLEHNTPYVFRAKAKNDADWGYSNELTFTTLCSNDVTDNAYQMKAAGYSPEEIVNISKTNLAASADDVFLALQACGYSAAMIASAMKSSDYKCTYTAVLTVLKDLGFNVLDIAGALNDNYYIELTNHGARDISKEMANLLLNNGYSINDAVQVLKEGLGKGLAAIYQALQPRFSVSETDTAYYNVYGAEALVSAYWKPDNPAAAVEKAVSLLKNIAGASAAVAAEIIKKVYPALTAEQFLGTLRFYYPASDAAIALQRSFGLDVPASAIKLKKGYYDVSSIKAWLLNDSAATAPGLVQAITAIENNQNTAKVIIPMLESKYAITSAADIAKAFYDGGWTRETYAGNSIACLPQLLNAMAGAALIIEPEDMINVLKGLGLAPVSVGNVMYSFKGNSPFGAISINDWNAAWFRAYKNQGYSAIDLASWFYGVFGAEQVYACIFALADSARYNLDEVIIALKTVYNLDAAAIHKHLLTLDSKYQWAAALTAAINNAFSIDIITVTVSQMKASGATAVQLVSTLKASFAINDAAALADRLKDLGYTEQEVLSAIVSSCWDYSETQKIQLIIELMKNVYNQEAKDNTNDFIYSIEYATRPFYNPGVCFTVLQSCGFSLNENLTAVKNYYNLYVSDAYEMLVKLGYTKADARTAVDAVYGDELIPSLIQRFDLQGYGAEAAVTFLCGSYEITDPYEIAVYLKNFGYSPNNILVGLKNNFWRYITKGNIELYKDVLNRVFNQTTGCMAAISDAYNGRNEPADIMQLMTTADYSHQEMAQAFKDDAGLTSTEAIITFFNKIPDYTARKGIAATIRTVYDLDDTEYEEAAAAYITGYGTFADVSEDILTRCFGYTDMVKKALILRKAGFSDANIIDAVYRKSEARKQAVPIMKAFYPEDDAVTLVNRITAIRRFSEYDLGAGLLRAFPDEGYAGAAVSLKKAGIDPADILHLWLRDDHPNKGEPQAEALVKVLGSSSDGNSLDTPYYVGTIATFIYKMGYSGAEALPLLLYNGQYSRDEAFFIMNQCEYYEYGNVPAVRNIPKYALNTCKAAGYSIRQLYSGLNFTCGNTSYYNRFMDLASLGYSLSELTAALLAEGAAPGDMYYILTYYQHIRSYLAYTGNDSHPYYKESDYEGHLPFAEYSYEDFIDWIIDGVAALPEAERSGYNIADEIARGVKMQGIWNGTVFAPVVYAADKLTALIPRISIPQADIDALNTLLNAADDLLSSGGASIDKPLNWLLAMRAFYNAGYSSSDITALLYKYGASYIMNVLLQVLGGYSSSDAVSNVMSYDSYKAQFFWTLITTVLSAFIPSNYKNIYKFTKTFAENFDKVDDILKLILNQLNSGLSEI